MSDTTPSPSEHAQAWLTGFDNALQRRDIDAAVAMMGDDCYWRDLVSFTWNICTQESPAAVRAMLAARLDDVAPSNWQLIGDATTADGVTEGWFTFETRLSRGKGLVRLINGRAWTLLTTMVELKGHEEKTGRHRAAKQLRPPQLPRGACRSSWAAECPAGSGLADRCPPSAGHRRPGARTRAHQPAHGGSCPG